VSSRQGIDFVQLSWRYLGALTAPAVCKRRAIRSIGSWAAESIAIGYGSDALVSAATGLARQTIRHGRQELPDGVPRLGPPAGHRAPWDRGCTIGGTPFPSLWSLVGSGRDMSDTGLFEVRPYEDRPLTRAPPPRTDASSDTSDTSDDSATAHQVPDVGTTTRRDHTAAPQEPQALEVRRV
jgi:hypothetical protein